MEDMGESLSEDDDSSEDRESMDNTSEGVDWAVSVATEEGRTVTGPTTVIGSVAEVMALVVIAKGGTRINGTGDKDGKGVSPTVDGYMQGNVFEQGLYAMYLQLYASRMLEVDQVVQAKNAKAGSAKETRD